MARIIYETENSLEITQLRAEVLSKRNCGEVLFEIQKIISDETLETSKNMTAILDLFVSQFGYSGLGVRWKEVNQEDAQKILSFIMTKDLAYSVQLMSLEEAENIIVKLFEFFPEHCKFFTNASFRNNYSGISGWDSITKATFDTGIIVVSDRRIGILWVQDED
ncbi:MAG: hypothetical protein KME49_13840 [Brasilonema octagenarum HA4186-MV1]|jgi:predicted  nucleic acid-binding Zn-ribbon protein|uniref:Uncharacterized protein n=2 Tax=Brasilonema TaxID=383614 RepID=A0A856MB12_9CYAN|nr:MULTISPECIES: hypothetical protein [Brasilonema]MBW4626543.1 hypothetical protein [Brasilonema octagenarum HA4186-MV1]NMF63060.1 hypothetical protein [Brasilonema octagenarum UFV-OR1]QDL07239.1 hypothetical protein DP114_04340 [Brasilonema sennae CENA114]QDL13602.1 hypothetical protein DP113_04290 [Brasilonema octagenarum UFV-E1]